MTLVPGAGGSFGRELVRALELARVAGTEVMHMRRGEIAVEMKADDEPVTVADRRASELIVGGLRASFPDDPVISEELEPEPGAFGAPRMWLVDPIDGTKDYIRNEDGYSVMIGLVCDGRPLVGVVYQPTIDRMFFATPDGAYVDHAGKLEPLVVSEVSSAADIRLVASKSHRSADLDRVKTALGIDNELNVGSVGVKLCLIAMGVRDLYVNPFAKTKAWDTAGPEAILVRAGGRLTDMRGQPIEYANDLKHRRGLIASNGRVHDEAVTKLAPLFQYPA